MGTRRRVSSKINYTLETEPEDYHDLAEKEAAAGITLHKKRKRRA